MGDALAGDFIPSVLCKGKECLAFGLGYVCLSLKSLDIPDIVVIGCNIPIPDKRDLAVLFKPGIADFKKSVKPAQFVGVVRMVKLAAVGYVQAPGCDFLVSIEDCYSQRASLNDLRITEAGLAGEVDLG